MWFSLFRHVCNLLCDVLIGSTYFRIKSVEAAWSQSKAVMQNGKQRRSRKLATDIQNLTGSITPFWVEQKANIIVTLVEIMLTFFLLQNVIRILNLVSLLHC